MDETVRVCFFGDGENGGQICIWLINEFPKFRGYDFPLNVVLNLRATKDLFKFQIVALGFEFGGNLGSKIEQKGLTLLKVRY